MHPESDGAAPSGPIASSTCTIEDESCTATAFPAKGSQSGPRPSPAKPSSFRGFGLSRLLRWHTSTAQATAGSKTLGETLDKGHVNPLRPLAQRAEQQSTGSQLFRTSLFKGRPGPAGPNLEAPAPVLAQKTKTPLARADWPSADPTTSDDDDVGPTDDSTGRWSANLLDSAHGTPGDKVCQDSGSRAHHNAAPTPETSVDDLTRDLAATSLAPTQTNVPETRVHRGAFQEATRNPVPRNTAHRPAGVNDPSSRPTQQPAGRVVPQVTAHRAAWVPDALEPPFFKPTPFSTGQLAPAASQPSSPSHIPRLSFIQRITPRSWGSRTSRDPGPWVPAPEQGTLDPGPQQVPHRHAEEESDQDVPDFWTSTPYPTREPPSTPPRAIPKLTLSPMTANRTVERAEVATHSPDLVEFLEESQQLEQRESSDGGARSSSSARVYSPLKTAMLGRRGWLRHTQLVPQSGPARLEPRTSAYRTAPGRLNSRGVTSRWPGWVAEEWYNSCHPVATAEVDDPCDPRGSLDGQEEHPTPAGRDQVSATDDLAERAPDAGITACKPRDLDVCAQSARREPTASGAPDGVAAAVSAPPPQVVAGQRSLLDVTASRLNANAAPEHGQSRKDWQASMQRWVQVAIACSNL